MASYDDDVDPVADFETAKRKFEMYKETLKKIPRDGVLLGKTMDVEYSDCKHVLNLVNSLERMAKPSAFCCGGWVELNKEDAEARLVMHADKKNYQGWPVTQLPVEELLEFCTPAPYGDLEKQETVYNPNVRLASECEASKFKFVKNPKPISKSRKKMLPTPPPKPILRNHAPSFLATIREKVSSTLAKGKDVSLQCYKLNVYGMGGFFSAHVDTPVDAARMIGTVVVSLPCQHTGGELIVKHRGVKKEFLFANLSTDQEKIQWAAFYSDCIHEILPVKSGHHITITYNILQKAPDWSESRYGYCKNQEFVAGPKMQADNDATLDGIVRDVHKIGQKSNLKHLGIFLQHKYTMSALAEGNLKGMDKVLCDGLESRGLTCHRLTVLVHEDKTLPYEWGEVDEDDDETEIYAFSREDMLYVNKEGPKPEHAEWKAMEFIKDFSRSKSKVVVDRKKTAAYNSWNYTEPGRIDQIYFQSTVIIDIPDEEPANENQGCCTSGRSDADEEKDADTSTGVKKTQAGWVSPPCFRVILTSLHRETPMERFVGSTDHNCLPLYRL